MIVTALSDVGMWEKVQRLGGLEAEMQVGSLSKGEGQLLSLARAVLRGGKIVLVDEATSRYVRRIVLSPPTFFS